MSHAKSPPVPASEPVSQLSPSIEVMVNEEVGGISSPIQSPLKSSDFTFSPSGLAALPPGQTTDGAFESFDLNQINYETQSSGDPLGLQYMSPFLNGYPIDTDQFGAWDFNAQLTSQYPDPTEPVLQQPYPDLTNIFGGFNYAQSINPGCQGSFNFAAQMGYAGESQTSYPEAPMALMTNSRTNDFQAEEVERYARPKKGEGLMDLYNVDRDNRRVKYRAEKPEKDLEHSWIRTNANTLGKSTRSGKINSYDPNRDGKYCETSHPVGPWRSVKGKTFDYNRYGELRQLTFSITEMQEFLFHHPLLKQGVNQGLTLWIQKAPADSGRRYPTVGSSKCRFEDCPGAVFSRTITVGHFRVAIDEQWETHKASRDPFHVAMYVHLYCMERFLDFAGICKGWNVRSDNRELISEPKGRFLPALDFSQHVVADSFIQAMQKSMTSLYPNYPVHDRSSPRKEKDHAFTLTCALTVSKNMSLNKAKLVMLHHRGLTPSNILVHKGDLQMAINARYGEAQDRKKVRFRSQDPATKVVEESENDDEPSKDKAHGVAKKSSRMPTETAQTSLASRAPSQRTALANAKKRIIEISSEEDELSDDDAAYRPARRPHSKKRQRQLTSSDATASRDDAAITGRTVAVYNAGQNDVNIKAEANGQSLVEDTSESVTNQGEIPVDPALLNKGPQTSGESSQYLAYIGEVQGSTDVT